MDWKEILAIITIVAVAPYATAAAVSWIKRPGKDLN